MKRIKKTESHANIHITSEFDLFELPGKSINFQPEAKTLCSYKNRTIEIYFGKHCECVVRAFFPIFNSSFMFFFSVKFFCCPAIKNMRADFICINQFFFQRGYFYMHLLFSSVCVNIAIFSSGVHFFGTVPVKIVVCWFFPFSM